MSEELVDLDTAKAHLRLTDTSADDDLQFKLDVAHAIVLDYVTQRRADADVWAATVAAWTDETAPAQVRAAILIQFGELCRLRGDDDPPTTARATTLHPLAEACLLRLRDPAFS